jgi:putative aminopeptidase FrvX
MNPTGLDPTERLLKELSEAPGVSGFEAGARVVMRRELTDLGVDIEQDKLGSLIARLPGTAERPRVMLAAHLDEVGFMVRYITDSGYIRFLPLGVWGDQVLQGHPVTVETSRGSIPGMIGTRPPHLLKADEANKVVTQDAMYIDIGAGSRREVEEMGVRVGDPIVPRAQFTALANGKGYLAKAWDDRAGCALIIEVSRALVDQPHPNTVYGVGTVQEESGLRGARTSAYTVDPDVGLVLEVALTHDSPDAKPDEGDVKLGGGIVIILQDASMLPNPRLRDLAFDTARELDIPVQFDAARGGATDGGPMHLNARGVPCLYVGVPARYVHCHQGIIWRNDYDAMLRLLLELNKRLDARTVASLTA